MVDVECQGCGKQYSVNAANAGRRGRCSRCGAVFTVPASSGLEPPESVDPGDRQAGHGQPRSFEVDPDAEGYALSEPEPVPSNAALDRSVGLDEDDELAAVPERPRVRKAKKPKGIGTRALESFDISLPKSPRPGQFARWRKPLIVAGVALGVLVLLGLIFPGLAVAAGYALVATGGVLLFVGMVAGAYTAFTEDFVHGVGFVVFWPYAAYYFVSRWDEMKPQLAAVLTGLVLLSAGAKALEYAHWRGGDGSTPPPAAAEAEDPR